MTEMECLYKITHKLSIAGKINDLEWPLSMIQSYL